MPGLPKTGFSYGQVTVVQAMASFRSWGISAEVERRYSLDAHPGAISFLAYLNQARMGSYQAALSDSKSKHL